MYWQLLSFERQLFRFQHISVSYFSSKFKELSLLLVAQAGCIGSRQEGIQKQNTNVLQQRRQTGVANHCQWETPGLIKTKKQRGGVQLGPPPQTPPHRGGGSRRKKKPRWEEQHRMRRGTQTCGLVEEEELGLVGEGPRDRHPGRNRRPPRGGGVQAALLNPPPSMAKDQKGFTQNDRIVCQSFFRSAFPPGGGRLSKRKSPTKPSTLLSLPELT